LHGVGQFVESEFGAYHESVLKITLPNGDYSYDKNVPSQQPWSTGRRASGGFERSTDWLLAAYPQ
jgi:hypothetical protein